MLPPDDLVDNEPQPQKKKKPTGTTGTTEVKEADASVPEDNTACKTVAPNNRCGLDPQCGCATNETCTVTNETTGATSCVSAGAATLGRPCGQSGDCVAGLTCEYGACRPYCGTPLSKCGIGGTDLCVAITDGSDKPIPNMNVCTIQCDPRMPAAVCGTNACHWIPKFYAPSKVTDCNFGGTIAAYDAVCAKDSECQPGLACSKHPTFGFECEKWCRIGQAPSDCAAGFTCKDVFGADAPVIGGIKEGLCQD